MEPLFLVQSNRHVQHFIVELPATGNARLVQ